MTPLEQIDGTNESRVVTKKDPWKRQQTPVKGNGCVTVAQYMALVFITVVVYKFLEVIFYLPALDKEISTIINSISTIH